VGKIDANPGDGRAFERTLSARARNVSNSSEPISTGSVGPATLTRSGTGLETEVPDRRRNDRKQEPGEAPVRTPSLTEQLRTQKAAVREAARAAAALQTQISSTQTQLKSAQEELEIQKHAGINDAARMAVRVSLLEEELAVVAMHARTDRGTLSRERNQWRGMAAAVTLLGILCLIWWRMTLPNAPNMAAASASVSPFVANQAAGGRSAPQKDSGALPKDNELPADPRAALTVGLDRLNDALAAVPETRQYEVLRKISANGQDCALVWTDNLPSLLFPGNGQTGSLDPTHPNELANTLADCAAAVSRLYPPNQPAEPDSHSGQRWAPGFQRRLLR
jgi:hypothetical protein